MSNKINECRLCGIISTECTSLLAVFDTEFDTYQAAVLYCTSVLLSSEDTYPQNICNECVKELFTSVHFKKKCEITHTLLQEHNEKSTEEKPLFNQTSKKKYKRSKEKVTKDDTNLNYDIINDGVRTRSQKRQNVANKQLIVDDFGMISLKDKTDDEQIKCEVDAVKVEFTNFSGHNEDSNSHIKIEHSEDMFDAEDILASVSNYDDNTNDLPDMTDSMDDNLLSENTFDTIISRDIAGKPLEKQISRTKFVDNKLIIEKIPLSKIKDLAMNNFRDRGDKTFECILCGCIVNNSGKRSAHYRTHLGPTHCDQCDKEYHTPQKLLSHLKRVHTGKVHVCHQCGKSYKRSTHLESHMVTHTGEKPHKCPHCGRGFTSKAILLPHIKCHLGVRDFICVICGIGKTTSSELRFHMRIHNDTKPFKCDLCDYTAVSDYAVRRHARRHNPIKPYPCPHDGCALTFSIAYDAKRHAEVHNNKNHTCQHCHKSFQRRDALRRHLVAEHDIQNPFKRKGELLIQGVQDGAGIYKTIKSLMRGRSELEDKSIVEKLLKPAVAKE